MEKLGKTNFVFEFIHMNVCCKFVSKLRIVNMTYIKVIHFKKLPVPASIHIYHCKIVLPVLSHNLYQASFCYSFHECFTFIKIGDIFIFWSVKSTVHTQLLCALRYCANLCIVHTHVYCRHFLLVIKCPLRFLPMLYYLHHRIIYIQTICPVDWLCL